MSDNSNHEINQYSVDGGPQDGLVIHNRALLADVAVAAWRLQRRVERENAGEGILLACQSLQFRLEEMGLRLDEMIGEVYEEQLNIRVIEHIAGESERISECLSPAVYFHGLLIKPADVVVSGAVKKG